MEVDGADFQGEGHNARQERGRGVTDHMNAAEAQGGASARIVEEAAPDSKADEYERLRKGKGIQINSGDGPFVEGGRAGPVVEGPSWQRPGGGLVGPANVDGPSGPGVGGGLLGRVNMEGPAYVEGPWLGGGTHQPLNNASGSDSCDPLDLGAQVFAGPASKDDADSAVGPVCGVGLVKEKPIIISEETEEDMDLGGEEGACGGESKGALKEEAASPIQQEECPVQVGRTVDKGKRQKGCVEAEGFTGGGRG